MLIYLKGGCFLFFIYFFLFLYAFFVCHWSVFCGYHQLNGKSVCLVLSCLYNKCFRKSYVLPIQAEKCPAGMACLNKEFTALTPFAAGDWGPLLEIVLTLTVKGKMNKASAIAWIEGESLAVCQKVVDSACPSHVTSNLPFYIAQMTNIFVNPVYYVQGKKSLSGMAY